MRTSKLIGVLLILVSSFLLGCSSIIYHREPKTGLYERRDSYLLEMFTDAVDDEIKRELRGEQIEAGWRRFWIDRCKDDYHHEGGEAKVQYVIRARREAGLPDIPEIESRKFNN